MNDFNLNLEFDLEKNKSNVIKVIGVGGGGGNAVNYMYQKGIQDVDFVVVNTDSQDLSKSPVPTKIQIGKNITEGLGAGANPEIGEKAANEDLQAIKNILEQNTKMIFITAGMGGGTGTGAAPIIAKLAKEMGILTVAIVTSPFAFEGGKRTKYAQKGIDNLRDYVDSLIIINNDKLRDIYGNLKRSEAFAKSDEVLASAASSIAQVITHNYTVNIDFRDVNTVLENSGTAIMGSARATGENRANQVIESALDSPLLNDNKIKGAKNVLLLIVSGSDEITIDEISDITNHIQMQAGNNADVIMGIGEDDSLGDAISVTVIATGFNENQQDLITNAEPDKIVHVLDDDNISIPNQVADQNTAYHNEIETPQAQPKSYIDNQGYRQFTMDLDTEEVLQPKPVADTSQEQNVTTDVKEVDEITYIDKRKEENKKETEILEKTVEQTAVSQPLLFNIDEEESTSAPENEIDDLSELPIAKALLLRKKRKEYMKGYISEINMPDEMEEPAFKRQGINIDLNPKSKENVHKIEMDSEGNFIMSESNSFLNDNVD